MSHPAILALEDGTFFQGEAFGAIDAIQTGEICFNTSMTGYQEVLTDPSYRGQIVTMTYPQIGNYGVNPQDLESRGPHVRGFVIGELCTQPSNFRSTETLDAFLKRYDIPGIEGIDTRMLTKKLRTAGAMRAVIATKDMTPEEAVALAKASPGMEGMDYVKEVTTPKNFQWDAGHIDSREWTIPNPSLDESRAGKIEVSDGDGYSYAKLPPVKHHIVAYDFGIKFNILRRLRQAGFGVTVVNASTSAEDVLAMNPDGIFLSNGPGDPAALDYVHSEIAKLIAVKPTFAICLGHQIISHAVGGKTFKLKFGHRGGNQPVKDLRSGKISITSQNHGFAVDPDSLPDNVEVTHVNLNDGTVEGLRLKDKPVFSVQYHPEAAPGPNDAAYFFDEFAALIESTK